MFQIVDVMMCLKNDFVYFETVHSSEKMDLIRFITFS